MRAIRTSESHPLWINEIRAGNGGGLVGITFCPGKRDDASGGLRWERNLSADLDVIAQRRPASVASPGTTCRSRMHGRRMPDSRRSGPPMAPLSWMSSVWVDGYWCIAAAGWAEPVRWPPAF